MLCPEQWTFVVGCTGLCVALIYFIFIWGRTKEADKIECEMKKQIENVCRQTLLEDFKITNKEINRRENITLTIGTIFVTASFLILGSIIIEDKKGDVLATTPIAAIASVGLFSIWLFILHLTTKHIDSLSYARLKAIESKFDEGQYEFGIHRFADRSGQPPCESSKKTKWWLCIRRGFWGFALIILSLCWIFLSFI